MFFQSFVSKYPTDRFCKNIFIGSFDVSGMTKKEAEKTMEKYLASGRQASVVMQVGEKEETAKLFKKKGKIKPRTVFEYICAFEL